MGKKQSQYKSQTGKNHQIDVKIQQKKIYWQLRNESSKLYITAHHGITYKTQMESMAHVDVNALKKMLENQQYQVLSETSTKLKVSVGKFFIFDMDSQTSIQIAQLNAKVNRLIQQNQKLKNELQKPQWEELSLANQEYFKVDCDYKFTLSDGYTYSPIRVTSTNLYHMGNSSSNTQYSIPYNSKGSSNSGYSVTKILKGKK